jgi:hypothetical protein
VVLPSDESKKPELALRAMTSYINSKNQSPNVSPPRDEISDKSEQDDLFNSSFYDRKPSIYRKMKEQTIQD